MGGWVVEELVGDADVSPQYLGGGIDIPQASIHLFFCFLVKKRRRV